MISIDLKSLVGKLNEPCRNALEGAAGLCLSRTHYNVEIEHWLLKLLEIPDSDMVAVLEKFEVNPGTLVRQLNRELDVIKAGNSRAPALSPTIVDLAKTAWMLASVEYGHSQVTSAHILAALMLDESLRRATEATSGELKKIPPESLRDVTRAIVGTTTESRSGNVGDTSSGDAPTMGAPSRTPALDKFTVNLTEAAKSGSIDAVLGRDEEVRQIIDILIRRRQNNPILTGEAGVGKTAVVEGFALRIASGDVPDQLKNVTIRSLDLGLLQAGASVKGEFENRLKSVIAEVKASPEPIIMFIDEAHTLIGAGGKEGQGDAANLLKPALARGELRTIAATTWAEYKKYFERDPALTRRFQVVKVEEPSEAKAIDMMRGISDSLQSHHKVRILDEAIVASVKLSHRYIPGRQLPDKSVSLLDTACARVALSASTTPQPIEEVQRRIGQVERTTKKLERESAVTDEYTIQIKDLNEEKLQLDTQLAALLKQYEAEKSIIVKVQSCYEQIDKDFLAEKEQKLLKKDLNKIKKEIKVHMSELEKLQGECPLVRLNVDEQAIAEVIANWTGIPVGKMVRDQVTAVQTLTARLGKRVIGQPHALEAVAQAIKTSRAGLTDPSKPVGVFLFCGTSGVGKTETALALADELFGGEQNITVINMSKFKEEHKISMLLGSPPGYVGYGEGGVLTEAARRKPYSVVLLDEMEKAHPGVQDIFYNLFDKGTIKDGEGRDIDFKNTLIIMTSNAGEDAIRAIFDQVEEKPEPEVLLDNIRPHLLRSFKPAFLGRVNTIAFYPLDDENLIEITRINMSKIKKRIHDKYAASFTYDDDVLINIVARCQESDTGARNIDAILNNTLLPALASECLSKMAEGKEIKSVHVGATEEGEFSYLIK